MALSFLATFSTLELFILKNKINSALNTLYLDFHFRDLDLTVFRLGKDISIPYFFDLLLSSDLLPCQCFSFSISIFLDN